MHAVVRVVLEKCPISHKFSLLATYPDSHWLQYYWPLALITYVACFLTKPQINIIKPYIRRFQVNGSNNIVFMPDYLQAIYIIKVRPISYYLPKYVYGTILINLFLLRNTSRPGGREIMRGNFQRIY